MDIRKIILGSAQFGLDYGISNKQGQVSEQEVINLLAYAKEQGISKIDTANLYGSSEEVLGRLTNSYHHIITKIPKYNKDNANPREHVSSCLSESLLKLKRERCYALLLHDANDLLGSYGADIYEALLVQKMESKVEKIGISVYSPEQALNILRQFKIDIIQFPINILDQRFSRSSFFKEAEEQGIELHARSIFLQGLLLMDPELIPGHFNEVKNKIQQLRSSCKSSEELRRYIISYPASFSAIKNFVFGVCSRYELEQIVMAFKNIPDDVDNDFGQYFCENDSITNPSKWLTS